MKCALLPKLRHKIKIVCTFNVSWSKMTLIIYVLHFVQLFFIMVLNKASVCRSNTSSSSSLFVVWLFESSVMARSHFFLAQVGIYSIELFL